MNKGRPGFLGGSFRDVALENILSLSEDTALITTTQFVNGVRGAGVLLHRKNFGGVKKPSYTNSAEHQSSSEIYTEEITVSLFAPFILRENPRLIEVDTPPPSR